MNKLQQTLQRLARAIDAVVRFPSALLLRPIRSWWRTRGTSGAGVPQPLGARSRLFDRVVGVCTILSFVVAVAGYADDDDKRPDRERAGATTTTPDGSLPQSNDPAPVTPASPNDPVPDPRTPSESADPSPDQATPPPSGPTATPSSDGDVLIDVVGGDVSVSGGPTTPPSSPLATGTTTTVIAPPSSSTTPQFSSPELNLAVSSRGGVTASGPVGTHDAARDLWLLDYEGPEFTIAEQASVLGGQWHAQSAPLGDAESAAEFVPYTQTLALVSADAQCSSTLRSYIEADTWQLDGLPSGCTIEDFVDVNVTSY